MLNNFYSCFVHKIVKEEFSLQKAKTDELHLPLCHGKPCSVGIRGGHIHSVTFGNLTHPNKFAG